MNEDIHLIQSHVADRWLGARPGLKLGHPIDGNPWVALHAEPIDAAAMLSHARSVALPALRRLSFQQRAGLLVRLARHLADHAEPLRALLLSGGATRLDVRVDLDLGIDVLKHCAGQAFTEWPDRHALHEGPASALDRDGAAWGARILLPRSGVVLLRHLRHAPCSDLLGDLAVAFLAAQPCVLQCAPSEAMACAALVRAIAQAEILPPGSLQFAADPAVDLVGHLGRVDGVVLRGPLAEAQRLARHEKVLAGGVTLEADCEQGGTAWLDDTVAPGSVSFDNFIAEVAWSLRLRAGMHTHALRHVIVPRSRQSEVIEALAGRWQDLGPMPSREIRAQFRDALQGCQPSLRFASDSRDQGAAQAPLILGADRLPPDSAAMPPGPAIWVRAVDGFDQAASMCSTWQDDGRLGLAKIASHDADRRQAMGRLLLQSHQRVEFLDMPASAPVADEGVFCRRMLHARNRLVTEALKKRLLGRDVVGSAAAVAESIEEYVPGARLHEDLVHPFRRHYDELRIGESLLTHRRTVTEADIVAFGCVSGDHFYMHFDDTAAKASPFGKRIAHGYFVLSAAAGLFVWPGEGPVLANYGLDSLRFIKPVGIGDTIQARLTCKRKQDKPAKPGSRPQGVVCWDVVVVNQHDEAVARYDILTLVAKSSASA